MALLQDMSLMQIKETARDGAEATFVIEPLSPGYGQTIGNALRRVLLSSLPGSAITTVTIAGVTHEFTALDNVKEDIIDVILNLKTLRVKLLGDAEIATIKLKAKGKGVVTAGTFDKNAEVEIVDPDHVIATLDAGATLDLEATVENGRGYLPTERRSNEKLPFGAIAIDATFSPVKKVHWHVDHTRVGSSTDYDKITLTITTDGSIDPAQALSYAAQILSEHFSLITETSQAMAPAAVEPAKKKAPRKTAKSKKDEASEE